MTFAVELKNISKYFGANHANKNISLKISAGSIHAIIGENGAGKSTAMNILYGLLAPDEGQILIHGRPVKFRSPQDAIHEGLGMIHQHFMLSPAHTLLDNIILGNEQCAPFSQIPRKKHQRQLEALTKKWQLKMPWYSEVEGLAIGLQQRSEILKALYKKASILIFDEPTAVLTPQETEQLFEDIRELKLQNKTILLITHKLKEVMILCDDVSILRAGEVIAKRKVSETSVEELGELMIGKKINLYNESSSKPLDSRSLALSNTPVLAFSRVTYGDQLKDVSFQLYAGEILGIAGVHGNGQSELCQCLIQPQVAQKKEPLSGEITFLNKNLFPLSTQKIRDLGIAYISEDRLKEGLLQDESICENFILGHLHKRIYNWGPFISWKTIRKKTEKALRKFKIKTPSPDLPVNTLSGGNQQKLIMARELSTNPRLFIVSQPTRGVDINSIDQIHQHLRDLQSTGSAILLVSSELDEILALSNRVLVMFEGRIAGEFQRSQCTEKILGTAMGGAPS